MEKKNRTKAVMLNSSFAMGAQLLNLALSFIVRTLLIKSLGGETNGLNGLFSNIVNILSFAELGIGSAISYSLYKPLAIGDNKQVAAIMSLFRKIYNYVAGFILVAGIAISFVITNFIHGSTGNVGNVHIAFLLFISNVVFSYLLSYKRTLLIADQQGYVDSVNRMVFTFSSQLAQVIGLILVPNYYLFLVIQMLSTVLSNWPILRRVNTEFSYLKLYKNESVDKGTVSYLKQNVVGMLSFKIGGIVITGTDNIILSSFLGLNVVGMYANYTLIITGIISLMNSVVNSITSSIGNLANAGNKVREKQVFLQFNMLNGLLTFGVGMGLILYFPTFMSGWLGHDFVLSKSVTLFIVLNFFVGQLRNGLINYLNAYGLYWQQRYKSIFEASLNLVVSLALVMQTDLGIAGVLLGTLASYLLIDFIWEPRIVIKNAIDINLKSFYFWYGSQIIGGGLLFYISQGLFEQYFVKNDWFFQMLITALFVLVGVAVFHIIQIFTAKLVRLQTENIWVVFSRIIRR